MNRADRAWQSFLQEAATQPCTRRDFSEWHRGRERYALWAIVPDEALLAKRLAEAEASLAGLLLPVYRRQPHITLHVCGFPANCRRYDDDFLPDQLQAQLAALALVAVSPFVLEVGGLGSFATAPYLTVDDPTGALAPLRSALAVAGGEWRESAYVPHITVGLYAGAYPVARVARGRSQLAADPVSLPMSRIALMTYDSRVVGGPLQTVAEFDLADKLLRPESSSSLFVAP